MLFFLLLSWVGQAFASDEKLQAMSEILAASKPSDWRTVSPENTLYMDLDRGRVVIELAPDFAPKHVENVKALARDRYWDGLAIIRTQDNYVVQWADPNSDNPEKKRPLKNGKATLAAEFDRKLDAKVPFNRLNEPDVYAREVGFSSGFPVARDAAENKMWMLHCYGAVGAGRDVSPDSGGGTELYAVIGHAPRHLDRNVTLVGRVIDGMEYLSASKRGPVPMGFYTNPVDRVSIKAFRLATDVPEKERTNFEVLRTDTPLFAKLVKSRKFRPEAWFFHHPQHIEVCNVPIPARIKH
ncbi:peptidylprolyl isomerase [bacterium]|jgi:peptidylprolyl isomerase|nr:peptidylprolyl isomerase [bacterium]